MKERPILFSAPMVRALLDGRKTQTRRVVKPQPSAGHSFAGFTTHSTHTPDEGKAVWGAGDTRAQLRAAHRVRCPYGRPSDRLWVKETWRPRASFGPWDLDITYAADGEQRTIRDGEFGERDWTMPKAAATGNVSPLFMPRWASRITLEITDVRVQRLHDISDADAIAEGVDLERYVPVRDAGGMHTCGEAEPTDPVQEYRDLWESINGAGAWDANPWVWAITFRRLPQ